MPLATMLPLTSLWLPILVSALVVFFASFLMWMVFPHHRSDWRKLPREDAVIAAMAEAGVGTGQYSFPHMASKEDFKDPDLLARCEKGPSGLVIVRKPGPFKMGSSLGLSLLHNLVLSILVAYLACIVLPRGTSFSTVFRVTSTAAFLAYAGSWPVLSIWFHGDWRATGKHVFDALVYALLVGAVFGAFWPAPLVG